MKILRHNMLANFTGLILKRVPPAVLLLPLGTLAAYPSCEVVSGERLMPVIELYTSEGCSS